MNWIKKLLKTDPTEQKQKEYASLMEKAYKLSHSNRTEADKLMAQADSLMKEIEELKKQK